MNYISIASKFTSTVLTYGYKSSNIPLVPKLENWKFLDKNSG